MDEAADVAELSNPPEPPPVGTAHRWFYDLRHSQSADRIDDLQTRRGGSR
jgi:hypothetical protein